MASSRVAELADGRTPYGRRRRVLLTGRRLSLETLPDLAQPPI